MIVCLGVNPVYVYICTPVCKYVYTHTHAHTRIYLCLSIYIHIYINSRLKPVWNSATTKKKIETEELCHPVHKTEKTIVCFGVNPVYVYAYACLSVSMYTRTHTQTHVYIYIYIYIYLYLSIYIDISTRAWSPSETVQQRKRRSTRTTA